MMRYLTMIEAIIILVLILLLISIFLKKKLFIFLIILSLLLGIIGFQYLSSQQFRLTINLIFNQVIEHKDTNEKGTLVLPLPKNTAFAYRSADNVATYFTTLSEDEIIIFFKELADKNSFIYEDSNLEYAKKIIKFGYHNTTYFVGLRRSIKPEGYYLYIESNPT